MNCVIFDRIKINWFGINQEMLERTFKSVGVDSFPIDELSYINNYRSREVINLDINETYLDIPLYDLTIYNICNDLIIFKDELDLELHAEVICKWFTIAKTIINDFNLIFSQNNFSLAIVINGYSLLDACLLVFTKKYKVPFLCIENTSNSNKIVWDDIKGKVITDNLSKKYFADFSSKVSNISAEKYSEKFKNTIFENKKEEHLSNQQNHQMPIYNKIYILFLAQVYCDSAQLFAIEGEFKNPIEIIETTINLVKDYKIPIVIKLHPKEIKGISPSYKPYDFSTYKRIKKLESENVIIDSENVYNTYKLIEKAQIIITVNSQAGLEACLYNKPVLTYSNNFYSGLNFTFDYSDKQTLQNNLEFLIKNQVIENRNLIFAQKFFYIFFEKYCVSNSLVGLLAKILQTGFFSKRIKLKFYLLQFKSYLKGVFKFYKNFFSVSRLNDNKLT